MAFDYYGEDDLIYNTASRIPVCFLIDISGSMGEIYDETGSVSTGETMFSDGQMWQIVEGGKSYIGDLVEAINEFYDAIKSDPTASKSCEVSVVTFGDNVHVLEDFETVDKKRKFEQPCLENNTNLGIAVNKALDLLEERKNKYKANGVEYFQPWLVIFTDGEPTDDVSAAQERCMKLIREKKLVVFPVAIKKDVSLSVLQGFSNKKPLCLKTDKISDFFEWLGKSVSVVSASKVGETIRLDVSVLSTFQDI